MFSEAGHAHLESIRPKLYVRKFGQRRKVKVMGEVNDVDDDIVEEAAAVKT